MVDANKIEDTDATDIKPRSVHDSNAYRHQRSVRVGVAKAKRRNERRDVYGVFQTRGGRTELYVQHEGHEELAGDRVITIVGLPLGGPGWRPPVSFWAKAEWFEEIKFFEVEG